MKLLHFDCFAGAAGDMILGALVDAGLDVALLESVASALPARIDAPRVSAEPVQDHGLSAVDVQVYVGGRTEHEVGQAGCTHDASAHAHHHGRSLAQVRELIGDADQPADVRELALKIYALLAEAEAAVHGRPVEEIHFHEVGAIDAVFDILATSAAICEVTPDRITSNPLPLGQGTFVCAHGTMPVPAPAVAEILRLRAVPTQQTAFAGELVTPTGAAILATLAEDFGPCPSMVITDVGYGAGDSRFEDRPNLLRVFRGHAAPASSHAEVELQANIDDSTPEMLAHLAERLASHCADVWITPVLMKKGRPGAVLSAICEASDADRVSQLILRESSSIGVRSFPVARRKLPRRIETVTTRFGEVRVKVSGLPGAVPTVSPEYEDCRRLAEASDRPIAEIFRAALVAWDQKA